MEPANTDSPPKASDPPDETPWDPPADDAEQLMEALVRNRECQKSMAAVLEKIQERVQANQMLQKKVKMLVKLSREASQRPKECEVGVRTAVLDWPGRKKPKKKRTSCSRVSGIVTRVEIVSGLERS
jgi:hypothetical protein